uniref:Homing endonuclease LAGLIDADG domain-containing protein n=1 Tax=Torulaspora globosa TaxID=48254 RepID=A0A0H3V1N9_9SACH|nr:hypothetical protein [Torulaspora globosa]AJG03038.1 hypothetical protein [Torulaspora globosa]
MKNILFSNFIKMFNLSLQDKNLTKHLEELLLKINIKKDYKKLSKQMMILLNKMNYEDNTKIRLIDYLLSYEINRINMTNTSYLSTNMETFDSHFSGFFDGDGSFRTGYRKGKRYTPKLVIELHYDDREYLNKLIDYFKLNNIIYFRDNNTKAALIIDVDYKLKPFIKLFDNNSLLTKKYYDYILWKELFNIYYDNKMSKTDKLSLCYNIYLNINKYNDIEKYPSAEHIINNINTNKVLGFIEAEGHFGIKPQSQKYTTSLEITQRKESRVYLEGIYNLIDNWKVDDNCTYKLESLTKNLYPDGDKLRVMIFNLDNLYYKIVPTILNNNLYTRKSIDFTMWTVAIIIRKHGLHHTIEGINLLNKLRSTMNKNRYNTNNMNIPSLLDILTVLSMNSIYDDSKPHEINYRLHASKTKLNKLN